MLKTDQIYQALSKVYDPEIPVNLVDLGLIYDVQVDDELVSVKMTLTAVGCPMHSVISENVRKAVEALDGVSETQVEIVWEPRWSPELISPEGRIALGMVEKNQNIVRSNR
ncbi:MAG: iron-sulfur cluster assembly protein [Candidatus Marinimicrobia bacterium]|nr:iron-sulfur cluster assembly protein [Candidatus Neomarinimicrobiota bacterium]